MKKTLLIFTAFILGLNAFSQIPNYVPSNGLVGWWPFNGNANDESGNGYNGTIELNPTLTLGHDLTANSAYDFEWDNVTGYGSAWQRIEIPSISEMSQSNLTINAWINPESFYWPNNNNQTSMIIGNSAQCASTNIRFAINPNGILSFSQATGVTVQSPQNSVVLNQWQMVTVSATVDSTFLYVNGLQVAAILNTGTPDFSGCLVIGEHHQGNGHWYYFDGIIDNVGIWNRALTQCEIQDLYNEQLNSGGINISAGLDQSICAGDNVTLSGTGGSNYQWNNNVVDGQAFSPAQSDAYIVTAQDSLGCAGTDTVAVTVLENASSMLNETALDSYTLNGQTYTQSGTYTQTLTAANGCDSTITLNLTLNFTGMDELGTSAKKLVKITDLNGKIIPRRKNTLMLFIYEDGTVERVVEMEE